MVNYVKVTNRKTFQNKILPELNSKKHTHCHQSFEFTKLWNCAKLEFCKSGIGQFCAKWLLRMIAQIVVFFRAKLTRKERMRFVPQKLRNSFANGNPNEERVNSWIRSLSLRLSSLSNSWAVSEQKAVFSAMVRLLSGVTTLEVHLLLLDNNTW